MRKRKHHPRNSFRLRRFKGKQVKLSYVQGKHQQGIMMGQGTDIIHVVNEDALRPSLFIFKSSLSMIALENVTSGKKLINKDLTIKSNKQRKQH